VTLREAWEAEAQRWIRFAREADVYAWRFNIPAFLEIVPEPGHLTLDVGCGEGRIARLLMERGHDVLGIDASPTLVEAARGGDPPVRAVVADAAEVPVPDGAADLAISFMTLQSVDDLHAAVAEVGRALAPGSRFCMAVVHPMNSLEHADGYFDRRAYAWDGSRDGIEMTFHDVHHPLTAYFDALDAAGLAVERLREPVPPQALLEEHPSAARWTRTACFLHLRAVKL
jgi:SAM-dependent methyltransferase